MKAPCGFEMAFILTVSMPISSLKCWIIVFKDVITEQKWVEGLWECSVFFITACASTTISKIKSIIKM